MFGPLLSISHSGWLDDIGLPQYKSQFEEGRVDGRMLHYMTVVGHIVYMSIVRNHIMSEAI